MSYKDQTEVMTKARERLERATKAKELFRKVEAIIKATGIAKIQFVQEVLPDAGYDRSRAAFSQWVNGSVLPRPEVMESIEKWVKAKMKEIESPNTLKRRYQAAIKGA